MVWGGIYSCHGIIRKMVVVFGGIFNDVYVQRTIGDNQTEMIKVPIQYAIKEKMLTRLQADPELNRPYSVLLPRLSFEIVDISPNRRRSVPAMNRTVGKSTDPNKLQRMYSAVPFDIKFQLHVYVKNQEDGTKIIEQILPFFRPDWTATVELINDTNMVEMRDIPFIFDNMALQDIYDGDFKQRQVFMYTLNFTCQTYLYGPIQEKPIIKFSTVDSYLGLPGDYANGIIETTTLQPSMLANGSPTTNAALSVAWSTINIDNDYGFGFEETLYE